MSDWIEKAAREALIAFENDERRRSHAPDIGALVEAVKEARKAIATIGLVLVENDLAEKVLGDPRCEAFDGIGNRLEAALSPHSERLSRGELKEPPVVTIASQNVVTSLQFYCDFCENIFSTKLKRHQHYLDEHRENLHQSEIDQMNRELMA